MTLKYLFILQTYGYISILSLNERDCNCPLDSVILASLSGHEDIRWTQLNDVKQYKNIQEEIDKDPNSETRLAYDFKSWQKLKKLTSWDQLKQD